MFAGRDGKVEAMGFNAKVMGGAVDGVFPHVQESIDEHNNPNNGQENIETEPFTISHNLKNCVLKSGIVTRSE